MIEFSGVRLQTERLREQLSGRIALCLEQARFIQGAEVFDLERALERRFCPAKVTSCSSGTSALLVALLSHDVGPGHAVFLPSYTFLATVEAVVRVGATPIFVDVEANTFLMSVSDLEAKLAALCATEEGQTSVRARAVLSVDLFGNVVSPRLLRPVCEKYGLCWISDSAQSLGGSFEGRCVGSFADTTTFSFFPSKPLGGLGDGGALSCLSEQRSARQKQLTLHGKLPEAEMPLEIGLNARLDTLQAAALLAKLPYVDEEREARRALASFYESELEELVETPVIQPGAESAWAVYTVVLPEGISRERVQKSLADNSVPSRVYYGVPLHQQEIWAERGRVGALPVTEMLSKRTLSLPFHAYLTTSQREAVVRALRVALGAGR